MDAPYLFPSLRACCKLWSQSLPIYTKPFGKALRHLRRLAFLSWFPLFHGSDVQPIRRELVHLSIALNWSQSSSVPNLLWHHQRLWWRYLKTSVKLLKAWTVRQKAALILHDLCTRYGYRDIERRLLDLHEEARVVWELRMRTSLRSGPPGAPWPGIPVYEALRGLPLKYQTIQFNAALVAQEFSWMHNSPPRWDWPSPDPYAEPLVLLLEHVPPTPVASSDTEMPFAAPLERLPRNPINYSGFLMTHWMDRVYF